MLPGIHRPASWRQCLGARRLAVRTIAVLVVSVWCAAALSAPRLLVTPDHPSGIYDVGQTVRWRIAWQGDGAPPSVRYVVKRGGLTEAAKGDAVLTGGMGEVSAAFAAPGTLLVDVTAKAADGTNVRALGGAIAAPDRIRPSAPPPADFDTFWAARLRELASVPSAPALTPGDAGKPGVCYWQVTMNNIRGTHIHGQLARPVDGSRLPALLIVQWAGVYGLQKAWVTDRAAEGWLVLNIEAHDLPIDGPEAFYQEQSRGPLANYPAIGNDDRETSYFLRMYLSCYRAADYLARRPDWNGRTLVVMGGSQGGLQALVTAGIHPKVTAALAEVPAGCDMLGPDVGRSPGWPMWYWQTNGKDPAKVHEASRYYDVVNFASRIRCPVLIGAGLIDETCPPAGIAAAANLTRGPHEVVWLPLAAHNGPDDAHGAYARRCWSDWLPALRAGKAAPVAPSPIGG